jgi:DNA-binding XRE family transcriptional regulator
MSVGKCLLLKRLNDRGMTQQELADKIPMNPQQINDYIHNRKTMSLKTARVIAKGVGCYIDDLYEWR